MTKNTTTSGVILFSCRCLLTEEGSPDDTLMAEEYLETADSDQKHDVFIENSPYDPAANVVMKDCPQCGLNYLVMVRIGVTETTIYTCSCGFRAPHDKYMKMATEGARPARSVQNIQNVQNTQNEPNEQGAGTAGPSRPRQGNRK
jgi:predicted RNA-binding Zn-ribbon protein involved in translation (DUF1610 family)